jgi:hypothetical protein
VFTFEFAKPLSQTPVIQIGLKANLWFSKSDDGRSQEKREPIIKTHAAFIKQRRKGAKAQTNFELRKLIVTIATLMKAWSKRKRWIVGVLTVLSLPIIFIGALFLISILNPFHAHEHCIKQTGLALRIYAGDHDGKYPFNTNGFGDAIVTFLKECSPEYVGICTAPGDDGKLLKECVTTGKHMPEEKCSRAYVQGLSETNNPEIAIVFDRYPTRGGDHFRRPWGPWLREVCLLDGSMQIINETNWPAFRSNQVELLTAEGFTRQRAEEFYKPILRPK